MLSTEQKSELRALAHVPGVAWPTMALFIICFLTWLTMLLGHGFGYVPTWLACSVSFVSMACLYMVMHESAHNSITRSHMANTVIGTIASLPLLGGYQIFRRAHLRHHAHTNDHETDPDHWSGESIAPLRWFTQDIHYVLRYGLSKKALQVVSMAALSACLMGVTLYAFHWTTFVFAWFIPWRLTIAYLAFTLNYLPHNPHIILQSEDKYRATVVRQPRWLKWVTFFQNYHNMHHLYPSAPFYRMEKMWDIGATHLKEKGTRVVHSLGG